MEKYKLQVFENKVCGKNSLDLRKKNYMGKFECYIMENFMIYKVTGIVWILISRIL
jgi:hypothetical protein